MVQVTVMTVEAKLQNYLLVALDIWVYMKWDTQGVRVIVGGDN